MPVETSKCVGYIPMVYTNKELQPFVRCAPKTRRDIVISLRHRCDNPAPPEHDMVASRRLDQDQKPDFALYSPSGMIIVLYNQEELEDKLYRLQNLSTRSLQKTHFQMKKVSGNIEENV